MKKQLHPGAVWQFRIKAYFTSLVIIIFLISFLMSLIRTYIGIVNAVILLIVLVVVLTIIFGEVYARMSYNRWFYEFTADNLRLERGIIWKRYSNIPYERVQNVDIKRGIFARLLGFSEVDIQTAGYSGYQKRGWAEGFIPGVDVKEAEEIREFLIKKIGKRSKSGL